VPAHIARALIPPHLFFGRNRFRVAGAPHSRPCKGRPAACVRFPIPPRIHRRKPHRRNPKFLQSPFRLHPPVLPASQIDPKPQRKRLFKIHASSTNQTPLPPQAKPWNILYRAEIRAFRFRPARLWLCLARLGSGLRDSGYALRSLVTTCAALVTVCAARLRPARFWFRFVRLWLWSAQPRCGQLGSGSGSRCYFPNPVDSCFQAGRFC
jgi:hypothetical protein